jgi:hypothetical protein
MFFSCPHCRDLVATDRQTNLPPVMCPRCGGRLRADVPREKTAAAIAAAGDAPATAQPSFVRFLQQTQAASATSETGTHLVKETSEATSEALEPVVDVESSVSVVEGESPAVEPEEIEAAAAATGEIVTKAPEPAAPPPAPQYAGPSFARQRAQPRLPARTAKRQWVALVMLAALLAVQVLVADRARLAADANWRPVITSLCAVVGCSVPAWHQPSAFAMLSRDVSPIPNTQGGLNVQATFRNDARWPQAWPVLLLSLSDADGRVLGSRAFSPKEYLGATVTQTELAPGQSAQIALKLHEPNPDVVAFSFDFR